MSKIITIGRELGSGGRTIGKKVASRLGIPYYDRELVDEAVGKSGLCKDFIETNDQRVTGSFLYNIAMGTSYGYGILTGANRQTLPLAEQIYIAQKEVIERFAEEGSCVIVGRCADHILSDRPDVLRVFLYADKEHRLERAVNSYGMAPADAKKDIVRSDRDRARHYNAFTEKTWGDRHSYDLLLDTGTLGIERCVDVICNLAQG
jgi:cytidylate kinase